MARFSLVNLCLTRTRDTDILVAHSDSKDVSQGQMFNHSDGDIAAAYADALDGENAYTAAEATRLRWKLDLRLITTSTAALYGMRTATGLTGSRYSWVGSAFYFGYLVSSLPGGYALQRLRIAKTMSTVQFVWGIVLIGTGFANNFATLLAVRVLLGAVEAPILPGNFLILGMWYPRREQPIRTGLMYTGLSVCFTGPIGYAIGYIPGPDEWRYFFWITGAMMCVWAVIMGIFTPDNPVKAKFVTERQKAITIDRIRADQTAWLIFLFKIWDSIPNGGLTNFAPLIINGLGYTPQSLNGRLAALYMSYFYLGPYIVGLGMSTANTA
ncbi:major facilitator superfamily domain-containing protein [Rhexocercosporidium sp. MPI-PUGE-AT-0058]|nr:major facilitator superfamily domain-containing protein [Rhexocercosporidium sp. MPI-PUGE-AT-0058]